MLQIQFILIILFCVVIFSLLIVRITLICALVPKPDLPPVSLESAVVTKLVVFYLEVRVENRASLGLSLFTSLNGGWLADFSCSRGHLDGMLRLGRYSAWITGRWWWVVV